VQEGRITAEDEDGANSDNPDGEPGSQARARRKRGSASTLAKDPAQLKSKKLEVEFSVDPLFRKTCADFDEGGAQGLLMSHLALSITPEGGMRMIFDASDAVPKTVEEEEQADEPEEDVDLSYLRSTPCAHGYVTLIVYIPQVRSSPT
jgi:condensin complex subunit 2